MSSIEELIQELDTVVQQGAVVSYSTLSATVVVLYEAIITFSDELQCIWLSSWTPITILHFLIRSFALVYLILISYVAINTNLSTTFCGPFDTFQVWGAVALVPAVDILIVIRVYALYNGNKWIRGILAFCWLAETAIIFTLTVLGFGPDKGASPNPLPGVLTQCNPTDPFNAHNLIIGGSVAIGFQAVYLGLALLKLARQFKSIRLLTPMLETFYRDGALYCFIILAMYGISVFFAQHQTNNPLQGVGSAWLVAIVSVTAGRLVLNLRTSVHATSTTNTNNVSGQSLEFQFTTPHVTEMTSTIILDTSRMRRSNIEAINDTTMEIELEPLPSSHDVALV